MENSFKDAWLSSTARWIAAIRERESARPDRLFDDPYAHLFAGTDGWQILKRSEGITGENKYIPVRIRYFDDVVLKFSTEIEQMVLFGAGYDTRALRLSLPITVQVFELDATTVLQEKARAVQHVAATCRISRVATNFSPGWVDQLVAAGFQREKRTLWLAEGLFFYLNLEQVDDLIASACANSAGGSAFVADLYGPGILELAQMASYLAWLRSHNQATPFTSANPHVLFTRGGWQSTHVVQAGQREANYGRVTLLPQDAPLLAAATYFVTATKTSTAR